VVQAGDREGVADTDGDADGECDGDGDGDGECAGDPVGVADEDAEGEAVAQRALEAVLEGGSLSGPGPTLAKNRASGTTTMPRTTVSTKVTAPHSRRTKAQFTKREV
jgi:hypothetical protein